MYLHIIYLIRRRRRLRCDLYKRGAVRRLCGPAVHGIFLGGIFLEHTANNYRLVPERLTRDDDDEDDNDGKRGKTVVAL